jgi:hypothetical protein
MNDAINRFIDSADKVYQVCEENEDYSHLVNILSAMLSKRADLIPYMKEMLGIVQYAFFVGIEHQKKQQIMQAFISAESEEK